MVATGSQMLGIALCIIGWIGTIVVCALPMWKVTVFTGESIVTTQTTWEGIWMACVVQKTDPMQCNVYDSIQKLSHDFQAARALIIISILVGIVGVLLSIAGSECANFVEDERSKDKIRVASGVIFILAGVMCLIPVCWTANTIISNFCNPLTSGSQKGDLGAALFIGWGAAGLLNAGGGLVCANCSPKFNYYGKYSPARSSGPKDYA